MKFTEYFQLVRRRPNRAISKAEWIARAILFPDHVETRADRRIRRWKRVEEMDNRYLRVVLLADGETVRNAFFDRGYTT